MFLWSVDELMAGQLRAQEGTQKRCRKTQLIILTGLRHRVTAGCKGQMWEGWGVGKWTQPSTAGIHKQCAFVGGQGRVQEKGKRRFQWCV